MILQRAIVDKRQLNRPIVRQVQWPPTRVVVLCQGEVKGAAPGKIPLRGAKAEIASGVAAVALKETPVEVKKELLPRSKIDRSRSMNRVSILSLPGGAKQSLGDCKTRIEEEVAGRKKQARTKQIATIELEHWNDLPR